MRWLHHTPIEEYEVLQLQMVLKLQHLVGGEAQVGAIPRATPMAKIS